MLVDNARAAEEATEHLIDMGYRRVACITGPSQAMTASERLAGYRQALERRGVHPLPALARHADFREQGGYAAMASLLADADPDAVFVANNLMTIGALECLVHHGIEVPREIGVVGFDEIPWADLVRPSLSTVAQPTYEMGKTAGQLLTSRRATPGKPAETVVLRTTLNVRASSTPRAAGAARDPASLTPSAQARKGGAHDAQAQGPMSRTPGFSRPPGGPCCTAGGARRRTGGSHRWRPA